LIIRAIFDFSYCSFAQRDVKLKEHIYAFCMCKYKKSANENRGFPMNIKTALKTRSHLGEGIFWDDRREAFFWVDILRRELHCLKDGKDWLIRAFSDYVGFCIPCEDGRLAVGCGLRLLLLDPETGSLTEWLSVDQEHPFNRFNDAKATPDGMILAGTMNNALNEGEAEHADTGGLFLIDGRSRTVTRLMERLIVSNGIAFTPDGKTVYHTDTYTQTICAYEYDGQMKQLRGRREAVKIPIESGSPDGFTIASDGTLFVAHWGGGAVRQYCPETGEELSAMEIPARHVTSCCFGGKNLDELFVTTSSIDASEEEFPLAGSIFSIKPGIKGMKVHRLAL